MQVSSLCLHLPVASKWRISQTWVVAGFAVQQQDVTRSARLANLEP